VQALGKALNKLHIAGHTDLTKRDDRKIERRCPLARRSQLVSNSRRNQHRPEQSWQNIEQVKMTEAAER